MRWNPGLWKWLLCGLLLLSVVLNYLDRQVLSLTAELITEEFHSNNAGFGLLITAFRISYAAVQFAGGWLVDAYGPRLIFPLAVGLWSCAGMLTGAAGNMWSLAGCRFLLGTGEALNWPCALKVTENILEPKDRFLANGIFNSGTAIGATIAPLLVTVTTLHLGWRAAFVCTGALGSFWIVAWFFLTRGKTAALRGETLAVRNVPGAFASIASTREFWLLLSSAVIVNGVSYFLADWIPLYLKTERGFGFTSGNVLSMIVFGGLDAGNLLVGVFVRSAVGRGVPISSARNTALVVSCLLMSTAALAGFVHSAYLAVAFIVLTAIGVAGFLVIYLTLIQEMNPSRVGTAAGMLGGAGNLAYALLSPLIGRLSDLHESAITFVLIGCLPWFAFGTIYPVVLRSERQQLLR